MPAIAEDDTDKGLLVGLGLTAASGKTSLGEGGGAIEAALLNQEALQQSGAIMAMIANEVVDSTGDKDRPVLVLTGTDVVDLSLPLVMTTRFKDVRTKLANACIPPTNKPNKIQSGQSVGVVGTSSVKIAENETAEEPTGSSFFGGGSLRASDFLGAAMIERTIGSVTVKAEDRQLANAVMMNRRQPVLAYSLEPNVWNVWAYPLTDKAFTVGTDTVALRKVREAERLLAAGRLYRVLGEPQIIDGTDVWAKFVELQREVDDCRDPKKAKTWLEVANTLLGVVLSTEKGTAPLTVAAQIESLKRAKDGTISQSYPLILRASVDQVGGTAISRSGILYSLGWPNAATVGAGLVTSFRLIDPATGQLLRQGLIRCMVRQNNIRRSANMLEHREYRHSLTQPDRPGETICDFKIL